MKHLAWLVVLAACTDFKTIERGVCGNGLIEAGEDCDSSDVSCVQCAVTCSTAADCPNESYACGVDGLCHAPGGAFAEVRVAGVFQADDVRVTDIDRDGIGDAVGLSRTSIVVRPGDPAAQLDTLDVILTPTQTGPAAFGDLDGDGSLDLALTTPDGIVSYSSTFGELAPLAVNESLIGDGGEPLDFRRMLFLANGMFMAVAVDPETGAIGIVTLDGTTPPAAPPANASRVTPPCFDRLGAITATTVDFSQIDLYNVASDPGGQLDAVLSIPSSAGACIVAIHRDTPNPFAPANYPLIVVTDITPAGMAASATKLVLADLDGDVDRCPGVVTWTPGLAAMSYFDGDAPDDTRACGTLAAGRPLLAIPNATSTAELVGRGPVVPNVALVAADALVTTEGLYAYLPVGIPLLWPGEQYIQAFSTTRTIARIVHGDLDGDGQVDIAFSARGEANLDLLYRIPDEAAFNLVRVETSSAVTSLTVGDFDANAVADLAFTEQLEASERMNVVFGTRDRPLAPISVGVFPRITDVSRVGVPDSIDVANRADDLVIVQPPAPGTTLNRLSILHGSPQRTLISYFDPRVEAVRGETRFQGAAIGHFVDSPGPTELADVVALAPPTQNATTKSVRAWPVPNTPVGLDGTASPGVVVSGINPCAMPDAQKVCVGDARFGVVPRDAERDVIIAIDPDSAMMLDPWSVTNGSLDATALPALTAAIPIDSEPRALHVTDLDGDGAAELIVPFAPVSSSAAGGVVVCRLDAGTPAECRDLGPAIREASLVAGDPELEVSHCVDATPARASYRDATLAASPVSDLVVVCRARTSTQLFRLRWEDADYVVERIGAVSGGSIGALRAGDVDGDGLDDLVLLEGEGVRSLLVVRQCSNRELACLEGR